MSLIDTHCHYNLAPLLEKWPEHWAMAQAQGVTASLLVGTDQASCEQSLAIVQNQTGLFAALGFHPEMYVEDHAIDLSWLDQHLSQPKVVAVGETGLDYFHFDPAALELNAIKKAAQQAAFVAHIQLANQHQLPLIVHARDKGEAAYRDVLALIQQHYEHQRPFVLHCASGPVDYIQAAVKLGAYIGFDGNLTYKNNQPLLEIFRATPADRRLLETDAPFLPPQPHRGKPCEPWMISLTAAFCQTQLGTDPDQFAHNAITCFGL